MALEILKEELAFFNEKKDELLFPPYLSTS